MPKKREFTQKKTVCLEHKNYTSPESLKQTLFNVGVSFFFIYFFAKNSLERRKRRQQQKNCGPKHTGKNLYQEAAVTV